MESCALRGTTTCRSDPLGVVSVRDDFGDAYRSSGSGQVPGQFPHPSSLGDNDDVRNSTASRAWRWCAPLLALVGVFVLGVVIATVGNILRDPICLGGGSECAGARPIWHFGGVVLYLLGTALAVSAPLFSVLVWRRQRAAKQAGS